MDLTSMEVKDGKTYLYSYGTCVYVCDEDEESD